MENNTKIQISTPGAIIVAGVLIMIAILATKFPDKTNTVATDKTAAPATEAVVKPVTNDEHIRGDLQTAKVVIIEYSDLECPFCKNFHSAMNNVIAKYPGKVAWVYRHFPLDMHPKARTEAMATECVASLGGNDAFWQYVDSIFAITPTNNKLDLALLPTLATKVGVDKDAFNDCLAKGTFEAKLDASIQDGLKAGVEGTPHSIIVTRDGTQYPIKGADEAKLNSTLEVLLEDKQD